MQDLMLHVERIVRPVRAAESRKLRMRRELLGHLLSAVEEERRAISDDAAAIERAKQRLGAASDLTRQLQRTVPWPERILLARMPVSPAVDRWEARAAARLYGIKAMGLLHISILAAAAGLLTGAPVVVDPAWSSLTAQGIPPLHPGLFFLSVLILLQLVLIVSFRFVVRPAIPNSKLATKPTVKRAICIVGLQLLLTICLCRFGLDRLPSIAELTESLMATLAMLVVALGASRWVARLRQPYEEWLTLDLAG